MGKLSRTKGIAFQSRVARWLREKLGLGNYQSTQGMETARGNIGDVRLEQDGIPVRDGFLFQTKKGKQPSPWRTLQEAVDAAESNDVVPVGLVHRDAKKPGQRAEQLVLMRPEDWARLVASQADDVAL